MIIRETDGNVGSEQAASSHSMPPPFRQNGVNESGHDICGCVVDEGPRRVGEGKVTVGVNDEEIYAESDKTGEVT